MNMPKVTYTDDDIFILGNIAALAIHAGMGEAALPLLKLVQTERSANAAAFIMEAMYLFSIGKTHTAITSLEKSPAFEADKNRDEALAFHLCLLQQDGQTKRAAELGQAYLKEGLLTSPVAMETTRTVVSECEIALGSIVNAESWTRETKEAETL